MAIAPSGARLGVVQGGVLPLPANTQEDEFVATGGQTAFTLTQSYLAGSIIILTVNGKKFTQGTDFTAVGTTVTWLDVDFVLVAGHVVVAQYHFA